MTGKPPLLHDDYCRIVGRVVIDTFLRIEHLEKQTGSLFEGFQAQTETLRTELEEARKRIAELEEGQGELMVAPRSLDDVRQIVEGTTR